MPSEHAASAPFGLTPVVRLPRRIHPVGHIGEPDDIAYGVVYLASDASKFVTSAELVIDGGYTAQ